MPWKFCTRRREARFGDMNHAGLKAHCTYSRYGSDQQCQRRRCLPQGLDRACASFAALWLICIRKTLVLRLIGPDPTGHAYFTYHLVTRFTLATHHKPKARSRHTRPCGMESMVPSRPSPLFCWRPGRRYPEIRLISRCRSTGLAWELDSRPLQIDMT